MTGGTLRLARGFSLVFCISKSHHKKRGGSFHFFANFACSPRRLFAWAGSNSAQAPSAVSANFSVDLGAFAILPYQLSAPRKEQVGKRPPAFVGAVSDDKSEPNASSISAKVIIFVPSSVVPPIYQPFFIYLEFLPSPIFLMLPFFTI